MRHDELTKAAERLLTLYRTEVRQTLEERDPEAAVALDLAARSLTEAIARGTVLSVGFLGASQVGKSSIINALLDERTLPSGGVGPLTAQATRVSYRDSNAFEVRYHDRQRMNQLLFTIREYLRRRGELSHVEEFDGEEMPASADLVADALTKDAETPTHVVTQTAAICEDLVKSVRLMLTQDGMPSADHLSRPALLDAIRLMLGQKPELDLSQTAPWRPAIDAVRARLSESESVHEDETDRKAFKKELKLRAAGWMSPLVQKLDVHLRKPVLHGLTLVDLPGVNNFADAGGRVATEFVRQRDAGALTLVLRNNLIDSGAHGLLHQVLHDYGIIERLLWGITDDSPALTLLFLITGVDNVARERWSALRQEAIDNDEPPPTTDSVFADVSGEIEARLRQQLHEALDALLHVEDADETQSARVRRAIRALAERVEVLCVSAPDYLAIQEKSGQSFVQTAEATNIPRLRESFRNLERERRARRESELAGAYVDLKRAMEQQVDTMARAYEEGGAAANDGVARFREALRDTQETLSAELHANRARAGNVLDQRVDAQIDTLLSQASESGHRKLKRLRKNAGELYWVSLNAALTNHGEWTTSSGRSINYPRDLTKAISEHIAGGWDDMVIDVVRKTTGELISSEVELVVRLCEAAHSLAPSIVTESHVQQQREMLSSSKATTIRWTRDRLNELTEEVEAKLAAEISPPIVTACERARRAGRNRGTGAKERILDAFEEGGTSAVDAAIVGAKSVLRRQCQRVLKEIRASHFRDTFDPVKRAFDLLTNSEGERLAREDAARRRVGIESVRAHRSALATFPAPSTTPEAQQVSP